MHCPNDNETLQMTSREGIEIDYCPKCRGVWLDRGELDKIIDRTSSGSVTQVRSDYSSHSGQAPHDQNSHHDRDYYGEHTYRKKKREGFMGDLFDF